MIFHRIQFTPDLLPSDVVGTLVFDPRGLTFTPKKGPIFANLLLADEINRAPSKVQSALLEAMEERQVTLGEESFRLPEPFLVLATQNPLEQEGTFPLPEAQMDRFLFKLRVDYPNHAEEVEVLRRADGAEEAVMPVMDDAAVMRVGQLAHQVRLDEAIRTYIVRLVQSTRPGQGKAWKGRELLRCGASPRASLALQSSSKAFALLSGRDHVLPDDVVSLAPDVLRHRLLLTYEAEADEVSTDEVIKALLGAVARP
jgi:MoxR-like ATPase